jgi:hypothetical protein
MTITGTHRGPISGLTHVHLLREPAAVRLARSADVQAQASGELPNSKPDPGPSEPGSGEVAANERLIR